MTIITVFGSGKAIQSSKDYIEAELAGKLLAQAGFSIATGGYSGIMEAALKGASKYDVERYGITTADLKQRKVNKYVTKEIKCPSYIDRMSELINISDAYLVMPGGMGTLLEFNAVWTMLAKGVLKDKIIVCIGDYWIDTLKTLGIFNEEILLQSNEIACVNNAKKAVEILRRHINGNNKK